MTQGCLLILGQGLSLPLPKSKSIPVAGGGAFRENLEGWPCQRQRLQRLHQSLSPEPVRGFLRYCFSNGSQSFQLQGSSNPLEFYEPFLRFCQYTCQQQL